MARKSVLRDSKRINLSFEDALHRAGQRHAKELRIKGGFSELLARLLVADLLRKNSAALSHSRHLPAKHVTK